MDRHQMISTLVNEEERANSEFVTGQLDRDTWTKTLQGIDDRLSVLGLRLAFRPWEGTTAAPKF